MPFAIGWDHPDRWNVQNIKYVFTHHMFWHDVDETGRNYVGITAFGEVFVKMENKKLIILFKSLWDLPMFRQYALRELQENINGLVW